MSEIVATIIALGFFASLVYFSVALWVAFPVASMLIAGVCCLVMLSAVWG